MGESTLASMAADGPKKTTIDRLYGGLGEQAELINVLDARLGVVSSRSPQDDQAKPENHIHLEDIAYRVEQHNSELRRLINELVV